MACCELKVIKSSSRFGGHTGRLPSIFQSVCSGTCGGYCTQFLSRTSIYSPREPTSEEDRKKTARWCELTDSTFYTHCPLNANLAKSDTAVATRTLTCVAEDLANLRGLPAACVIHIGKVGTLETVADRINFLSDNKFLIRGTHDRVPHTLLLEIAAGQKTELGKDWEELRKLYEALDTTKVGLCIDTAHAWGSGM